MLHRYLAIEEIESSRGTQLFLDLLYCRCRFGSLSRWPRLQRWWRQLAEEPDFPWTLYVLIPKAGTLDDVPPRWGGVVDSINTNTLRLLDDVKTQLNETQKLNSRVQGELQTNLDSVKTDITDIKTTMDSQVTEITDFKTDIKTTMDSQMTDFKTDITDIKTKMDSQMAQVKTELKAEMESQIAEVKADLGAMSAQMSELKELIKALAPRDSSRAPLQ